MFVSRSTTHRLPPENQRGWQFEICNLKSAIRSGGKTELCPTALGVVFRFAAVLLVRRLESAQTAHFFENALGIKLVLQPLERAIDWLTFANEYFWHQYSTPIVANSLPNRARPILIGLGVFVKSGANRRCDSKLDEANAPRSREHDRKLCEQNRRSMGLGWFYLDSA